MIMRQSPNGTVPPFAQPFDVARWVSLSTALLMHTTVSNVYESYSKQRVIEVVNEGSICRVTTQHKKYNDTFIVTWFDREQGYSPIRIEARLKAASAAPFHALRQPGNGFPAFGFPRRLQGRISTSPGRD